jgi:hypothetical protein
MLNRNSHWREREGEMLFPAIKMLKTAITLINVIHFTQIIEPVAAVFYV